MPRFSDAQIRELASGAGYDRVPRFVTRFADAIGSVEGRILRYLAHRTLGFGQYATVVSTRDLAAIAGTNNYQPALDWLLAHGVVGREAVSHGGRRTYAHWIHTDYTAWDIPHEVWLRLLALREQGCWDDPRCSSEGLQHLDRRKMVKVSAKAAYDVDDLKGRVERAASARWRAAQTRSQFRPMLSRQTIAAVWSPAVSTSACAIRGSSTRSAGLVRLP
jgi:hypothetical protein